MLVSRSHVTNARGQSRNIDRSERLRVRSAQSIAELAIVTFAPAFDAPCRTQRAGKTGAGRNATLPRAKAQDVNCGESVRCGVIPNLAKIIVSPAFRGTRRSDGAALFGTAGQSRYPKRHANHVHRSSAIGRRAIAELAVIVGTPANHAAGGRNRAVVCLSNA